MDRRLLELLVNKPDLVGSFPEWMLPTETIAEMRESDHGAIAEIAGRDSIAAVLAACEARDIRLILPTVAYTGSEYGNWSGTLDKIESLRERLRNRNVKVFDAVVLGSPTFWWKLCGRYTTHFANKFGFYSPCVGCHLYFHAIRIPLAKKVQCPTVIGGERESHDEKLKVNQIKISLDYYCSFMRKFGIELFLPIRYMKSGKEIESIIHEEWKEGEQQLACVLGKNYLDVDGSVSFQEEAIIQYMDEFALPLAESEVGKYLE